MLLVGTRPLLDQVENRRYKEDSDGAGSDHAADDGGAHNLTSHGAGAGSSPERNTTENESEGGHQNRAQTESGSFQRGVGKGLSLFKLVLGEFHDKNGVFGGQADEPGATSFHKERPK